MNERTVLSIEKECAVQIVSLEDLAMRDAAPGKLVAFPLHAGTGTAASAAVYFVLEPGVAVGTHTDSSEELLVILEGEAEATVGDERGTLRAGDVAVVPPSMPHDVRNVGDGPLRVFGAFAGSTVVHVFEDAPGPDAPQVIVTGAPVPMAGALEGALEPA